MKSLSHNNRSFSMLLGWLFWMFPYTHHLQSSHQEFDKPYKSWTRGQVHTRFQSTSQELLQTNGSTQELKAHCQHHQCREWNKEMHIVYIWFCDFKTKKISRNYLKKISLLFISTHNHSVYFSLNFSLSINFVTFSSSL